mmetsp:Transcript_4238/g.5476  ORF Transcript_4238/g.5476 Transcript_4238/m.5476 type:complete len:342 (+) Transcript_4238:150-1175(+)
MNVIQEIKRINERELELGVTNGNGSWHDKYKNSAWVFVGGLPYELTEGDIVCFMSQWGEIEDVNYVRDKETGKPKGFCFVKYEDQRSTILAVDNFNGIELVSRTLRVDHVDKYRLPKEVQEREDALEAEMADEEKRDQRSKFAPGHAYKGKQLETKYDLSQGQDLFKSPDDIEHEEKAKAKLQKSAKKRKKEEKKLKKKQEKKEKKKRKKEKETQRQHEGSLGSASSGLQQGDTMQENKENNGTQKPKGGFEGPASSLPIPSWRGRMDPAGPPSSSSFGRGGQGGYQGGRGGGYQGGRGNAGGRFPPSAGPGIGRGGAGNKDYDVLQAERNKTYGGMNRIR